MKTGALRLVVFLAALTAAIAVSGPHPSVALEGLPLRYVVRVVPETREAGGTPARAVVATGGGRSRSPSKPRRPVLPPAPRDTTDERPAGADSAQGSAAIDQSIAITVQVQNIDTGSYIFSLAQNYPNPCRNSTVIRYSLARAAHFKVEIFSITGQKVATLADREHQPGNYAVTWDLTDLSGSKVPPGVYFYRGSGGWFTDNKRLIVN